jgi:hypothetical protein
MSALAALRFRSRRRAWRRAAAVRLGVAFAFTLLSAAWAANAGATASVGDAALSSPDLPAPGSEVAVDVVVVGSEPEAIVAAIAAAEEGARTLLVTEDERLGGLFVLGELAMLDLRTQPHDYQLGLFDRWWRRVGRGKAFDVARAERAFEEMLAGAGVTVWRGVDGVRPAHDGFGTVTGVFVAGPEVHVLAHQVLDGSADADLAAAAGAAFDLGWAGFGVDQRMADTLVFRVRGVDWDALERAARRRGHAYGTVRDDVAWGSFGDVHTGYQPVEAGLRLRGLNLGRQDDGSVLVNALLVFGVDPFDADSRAEGRERATRESPRVVAHLAQHLPGFEDAEFAGVAERLYVRETRHLRARCVLNAEDVFDNRVTHLDVAAGGYPLDAQSFTPHDNGIAFGVPDMYGGRLCMLLPQELENVWVVGRSAGYDPVAYASARVVPFGMAMAEAAGVAAARAAGLGLRAAAVGSLPDHVTAVRARLAERGAYLPSVRPRPPIGPIGHPRYPDFRLLASRGLAGAGYDNDPGLEQPVNAASLAYMLQHVATRFHQRHDLGARLIAALDRAAGGDLDAPLTAAIAAEVTYEAACALALCPPDSSWTALAGAGLVPSAEAPPGALTRAEMYGVAAAVARRAGPYRAMTDAP